ncbi:MAG: MarR family winged helix-turn-helix transcriptional regulator [Gaiellaceae bacterium]
MDTAVRLRPVVLQLARELRRELHALGLTGVQASLLAAVHHHPGIGLRALAERERMSAPSMSGHIDRLERAGYVTRTRASEGDRRRVGLALSAEGGRILRKIRSRRTAWLAARLQGLAPAERAAIDAALEPLARLLEQPA